MFELQNDFTYVAYECDKIMHENLANFRPSFKFKLL